MRLLACCTLVVVVSIAAVAQKPAQRPAQDELHARKAAVIQALDLTRPEMAVVAAALRSNDEAAAERALSGYLRERTSVSWKPVETSAPTERERKVAEEAAVGKLAGGGNPLTYAFPNGDVDWHYNATQHIAGMAPDDEWQWQMNRMSYWGDLGRVYAATHDGRYAQAFVRELRSWVAQCPVPVDHAANGPGSAWRTIEAGIRMGGPWPQAFFDFRTSPAMTDDDLILFAGAVLDHGRYLRAFHTRLNWFTMEMSGLYAAGALFPEFKEAAEWRAFASGALAEEARKQILNDGAQAELSTGYQNVALGNILRIAEIARWTGRTRELPAGYSAPLEKGYEWQMKIMTPERTSPRINDSGVTRLPELFTRMAVENFPARRDFEWVATDGAKGEGPKYTSVFLDRSGLVAMRSGWGRGDNYMLFRLGPLGMGHQHQDKLGVILFAYGRELLFDSGGGSYEHSKWRQWAVSTYSHNCMIVDGMAQNRSTTSDDIWHDADLVSQGPLDGHWQTTSAFDFASGVYDGGYGPDRVRVATQQRDVLFVKPDLYMVADRMHPLDGAAHRYEARWQLLPTKTEIDAKTQTLVTADAGVANVAIVPLLAKGVEVKAVSGQEEPEILGWNVRVYDLPRHVPATTLLHTVGGTGDKLLLTLIAPLKPGEANPVAAVAEGADGRSATVRLKDGRTLEIAAAAERGIRVKETLANGTRGRVVESGAK